MLTGVWFPLDDEMYLDAQGSTQNLGEISVEIWHAVPIGQGQHMPTHLNGDQKVHESSKKALAHRIKYVCFLTLSIRLSEF